MTTREFSDTSTIDLDQINNKLDMIDREIDTEALSEGKWSLY